MSFPICSTNKSDPPIPAEIHESAGPPSYVSPQVQPLQLGMMDPFNYSAVAGPSQPSDSLGCVPEAVQWSLNTDLQTSASSVCSPPRMEQQCEGGASVDPPPHNNITVPSCQKRNPNAFRPKVIQALSRGVKGWHAKGCKCKRSHCLKNYCECFEADISCTPTCKCVGCMNKF
ncbi:protein tesmin/TSO1-like CXC 4 [Sphaeramia orbicularis]|uniref:protein tesmin/TSO1-like CXC 4 n=1 Tax=Sphaeramia orbicularis TaxID=375764 RepID=UPI00117F0A42|nr:protein tesmin/TSO1-like CXC 4 [Sphaeramia orbicularis]